MEGEGCVTNCYQTCKNCSDYSLNETDQKCLACKDGYIFLRGEKTQCFTNEEDKTYIEINVN